PLLLSCSIRRLVMTPQIDCKVWFAIAFLFAGCILAAGLMFQKHENELAAHALLELRGRAASEAAEVHQGNEITQQLEVPTRGNAPLPGKGETRFASN